MPVFAYRALTTAGRAERGVVDADSSRGAWQVLRARGLYPTDLSEGTAAAPGRVPAAELAAATRQLATLVEAGLPVADALEAVAEAGVGSPLAQALTVARARVCEGSGLGDALATSPRVFPTLYCDLVRAGEASGALGAVLDRLARHVETAAATRARLRAALTYPAVVLLASAAVLGFVVAWVVPQVTRLFTETGTPLPLPTRVLLGAVTFARATWWAWLAGIASGTMAFRRWAERPGGRATFDAALLRLPLLGPALASAAVARLARTMATLLLGGVPLEQALGMAAPAAGNRQIVAATGAAREGVRRGQALAAALADARVFPPLLVRLAATGERTGALAAALERAADAEEARVESAVATATALVEPALVVVMGVVVLTLVLAILLPILTLDPVGQR
jgi:general secretion pathway protein F